MDISEKFIKIERYIGKMDSDIAHYRVLGDVGKVVANELEVVHGNYKRLWDAYQELYAMTCKIEKERNELRKKVIRTMADKE